MISSLEAVDLAAVLRFAEQTLSVRSFGQVPRDLLGGLAELVGCDDVKLTHLDLRTKREVAVFNPASRPTSDELGDYAVAGRTHPLRQPLVGQFALPPQKRLPLRISDVLGARQWRSTTLYGTTHRHVVDQMGVLLARSGAGVHVLTLARRRGRVFTDRQRDVLFASRTHLAAAIARAQRESHHLALEIAPQVRWVPAQTVSGLADGRLDAAITAHQLSPRERQVLAMVAAGQTDAQVARALVLSTATVSKHLQRVYARLQLPNRAAAARYWTSLETTGSTDTGKDAAQHRESPALTG